MRYKIRYTLTAYDGRIPVKESNDYDFVPSFEAKDDEEAKAIACKKWQEHLRRIRLLKEPGLLATIEFYRLERVETTVVDWSPEQINLK